MSLIHRRKSAIFNNPQLTLPQLKIQQLLTAHKQKLQIANQTRAKLNPSPINIEKLSLQQAIKIENLCQQMNKTNEFKSTFSTINVKQKNKRISLNQLLKGFDRNSQEGICKEVGDIDKRKIDLFRSGKYYRSVNRAQGAGIKKIDEDQLGQYFCCDDSILGKKKVVIRQQKGYSTKKYASTAAFSNKNKNL